MVEANKAQTGSPLNSGELEDPLITLESNGVTSTIVWSALILFHCKTQTYRVSVGLGFSLDI